MVEKKGARHADLWPLLVLVLVAGIMASFVFIVQIKKEPAVELGSLETEIKKEEKIIVNSYVGEIVSITEASILVKAEKENNILEKNLILKVWVDEKTEFSALYVPKEISWQQKLVKDQLEKEDLKIGQKVVVLSQENIFGKQGFLAEKIEVHVVE